MDCAIFSTYRCNAKCGMCDIWKYPTSLEEEFKPELLKKLPSRIDRINISGGEPTLRSDLEEIVSILQPRTTHLEISTNGYFPDRLERLAKKYPKLIFRISIEGLPKLNDKLRGLDNGFDRALRSLLRIRRAGIENVGFATTISGENHKDLLDVYSMCTSMDIQLANAVVHNSFYFKKEDNSIENTDEVADTMKEFISLLLQSPRRHFKARLKDWFRAYINLGLLHHMQGKSRPLHCTAGTDAFFLDPYGRILACNGSAEPFVMGDLNNQEFEEIWESSQASKAREQVAKCNRQCWMTGTAVPAMKKNPISTIKWVLSSKMRLAKGKQPIFTERVV